METRSVTFDKEHFGDRPRNTDHSCSPTEIAHLTRTCITCHNIDVGVKSQKLRYLGIDIVSCIVLWDQGQKSILYLSGCYAFIAPLTCLCLSCSCLLWCSTYLKCSTHTRPITLRATSQLRYGIYVKTQKRSGILLLWWCSLSIGYLLCWTWVCFSSGGCFRCVLCTCVND